MRRVSYSSYRNQISTGNANVRIFSLLIVVFVVFSIIIGRLFQLQILRHDVYSETAKDQHFGAIDLPARRGDPSLLSGTCTPERVDTRMSAHK